MYNNLTLQLLHEGYTADNHPSYVQVDTSRLPGNNPLRNLGGGFVYVSEYLNRMVFKTPCGFLVKGGNVFRNMSFHVEWQPENGNPVIRCPFSGKKGFDCRICHPLLEKKGVAGIQFCSCHQTDEPYSYDHSVEKARDDEQERRQQMYEAFVASKNGHVCLNHVRFNEELDAWEQNYSPEMCAHRCYSAFCPIRGRELDKKKANVFYDVYRSGVYEDGFIVQEWQKVEKGIRFFKKPVSRDICEAFVKMESESIARMYQFNHSSDFLFDKSLKVEVKNIRVESRASRDLQQDLLDIQEGRFISWAPADEKKKKEEKKARRMKAAEKRRAKLEQKVIQLGFANLADIDKLRAEKIFSSGELDVLEEMHLARDPAEDNPGDLMDYIEE